MAEFVTRFFMEWNDILFEMSWKDRADYLAARAFLDKLTGGPGSPRGQEPPIYLLRTKQDYDAIQAFSRELALRGRPGSGSR